MHTSEDLSKIACGSNQHSNSLTTHRQHSHGILRIRLQISKRKRKNNQIPSSEFASALETLELARSDPTAEQMTDLSFSTADEIDGIGLGLESGGRVVTIPHPLRIVDADHRSLSTKQISFKLSSFTKP